MRLIQTPVRRSKVYEATLQRLGQNSERLFPTLREALSFCAVLGYKERRRLPLDRAAGFEDIASAQYTNQEAVDIIFALALAETKNSDILKDDCERECVQIFEEYANGGLALIESWLDRHADIGLEDVVWRGLKSIGVMAPVSADNAREVVDPTF